MSQFCMPSDYTSGRSSSVYDTAFNSSVDSERPSFSRNSLRPDTTSSNRSFRRMSSPTTLSRPGSADVLCVTDNCENREYSPARRDSVSKMIAEARKMKDELRNPRIDGTHVLNKHSRIIPVYEPYRLHNIFKDRRLGYIVQAGKNTDSKQYSKLIRVAQSLKEAAKDAENIRAFQPLSNSYIPSSY